jgi:uncharacterized protein YecE (DUF72 family)
VIKQVEKGLEHHWYFGTSSWKYPGWKGLIYKEAYSSEKQFQDSCLKEYSNFYSCVGVDHTYYSWPTQRAFSTYIEQTSSDFKFLLKATDKITVLKYPNLPRYGKEAGKANESFLDADLFIKKFLTPLMPFKDRIGPIMFEFSQFYPGAFARGSEFVDRLDSFLEHLNLRTDFQFAVEIRNSNWLQPAYFDCLVKHRVGHVFNSWTRMPLLQEQLQKSSDYPLPFFISRLLLRPGTIYQDAVDAFSPYNRLHQEFGDLRGTVVEILFRAKKTQVPAYVLVNNRFEGCAPKTLEGIFSLIEAKEQEVSEL